MSKQGLNNDNISWYASVDQGKLMVPHIQIKSYRQSMTAERDSFFYKDGNP